MSDDTKAERTMTETRMMGTLFQLMAEAHGTARLKGWWDDQIKDGEDRKLTADEIGAKIALMHSELSEGLEEVRRGEGFYQMYLGGEKSTEDGGTIHKPEGLAVELADCVIRIFDLSARLELDLPTALLEKMNYNRARPHRHGGKAL